MFCFDDRRNLPGRAWSHEDQLFCWWLRWTLLSLRRSRTWCLERWLAIYQDLRGSQLMRRGLTWLHRMVCLIQRWVVCLQMLPRSLWKFATCLFLICKEMRLDGFNEGFSKGRNAALKCFVRFPLSIFNTMECAKYLWIFSMSRGTLNMRNLVLVLQYFNDQ